MRTLRRKTKVISLHNIKNDHYDSYTYYGYALIGLEFYTKVALGYFLEILINILQKKKITK